MNLYYITGEQKGSKIAVYYLGTNWLVAMWTLWYNRIFKMRKMKYNRT